MLLLPIVAVAAVVWLGITALNIIFHPIRTIKTIINAIGILVVLFVLFQYFS